MPLKCRERNILVRRALNSDADSFARGFLKKRFDIQFLFFCAGCLDSFV